MKFVLNEEGTLVPLKESRVKQATVLYAKPMIKTVVYGAAFYIGYHLLQFFLTGGLSGFEFAFHEVLEMLGFGSYFSHPFSVISKTKSF